MSSRRRIIAAVTVLHAVVGAWIATSIRGPLLAIDDLAYLSMGRTLAGGGAAPLGAQPPYGVLYPSLLAPGWLVGLDEAQMIVFAQVVNAVLGAALLPVLYVLVRRLTDASFGRALGAAAIGASLPAAFLTGAIVWTERLLPLLVALAALALLRLGDLPTVGRGGVAALLAVAPVATHPRMIVVTVVVFGAALRVGRRGGRSVVLAIVGIGGAGLGVVEIARRELARRTFGAEATYDAGDLAGRRGLDDVTEMLVKGGGTVAYLLLASAGLVVLGAALLVRERRFAALQFAMVGGTVAVAGWFLTGIDRADAFLHGRYIEVFAPLLVAVGVVAAREIPWRLGASALAVSVVVAGLYAAWAGPGDNWADPRTPVMMLGVEVSGAPFGGGVFQPGAAAAVALVAGLLLLAASRGRTGEAPFVAALFVAMAVLSGIDTIDSLRDDTTVGRVQSALAEIEIDELVVEPGRVPSTLLGAIAWEVGLDRTGKERSPSTTHLLLPPEAVPPEGAVAVAELDGGTIWALD